MSKDYDGWVMTKPEWDNYIDAHSFRTLRTKCISDFVDNFRWSWSQLRRRGWRCIKVKLVPISEESADKISFPRATLQQILDAGWNGFAVQLLAESTAMDPLPTKKIRFSYESKLGRVGITIEPLPKTAVSEEVNS